MSIKRFEPTERLSKALTVNGHVYISGLTARNKNADVHAQTLDVLAQIDHYLALAGTDKTKLVKVNIWLSDISTFDQMNAAWVSWVSPEHPPTRATVESKLAGSGSLVEMMAEAVQ